MSVTQQLSTHLLERRRAERFRIAGAIGINFGRGEGLLVDLSRWGARVRHAAQVRRGTTVRISFEWQRRRFSAHAEVLAARVISLGKALAYESRLRFTSIDDESDNVLALALEGISQHNVRRWIANLRGWNEESTLPVETPSGSYIRCRLHGSRWERKSTTESTEQPIDGFLLPADSSESEILTLCDTYERSSEDERQLIRSLAAAAVEHSIGRN
jgi:hypothetical protein